MPIQLHAHQEEVVAKMRNGCILYGDVGGGKTITSLAYYFTRVCGGKLNDWGSLRAPRDVYVITTAKVRNSGAFEAQAALFGVHANPEISTNGVKITVDSWNNISKYVGVKDAFFIFDEQRVVGYGSWSRSFIKIARANEWILLSATPGDTWLDYIPVFIANGFYRNKTDFIDTHVVWTPRVKYPKVQRYTEVHRLVKQRNQVLVHMPFKRHTKRHEFDITCDYDEVAFDKAVKSRWNVFESRPIRDAGELVSVIRRIVNSDTSRVRAVQQLLSQHPKLIVFYNFDYELELLRQLGTSSTRSSLLLDSSSETKSSSDLETPSTTTSGTKPQTQPQSSTPSVMSSEFCEPQTCEGHWTIDEGDGEWFYRCVATPQSTTSSSRKLSYSASGKLIGDLDPPASVSKTGLQSGEAWEWLLSEEGLAANRMQTPSDTQISKSLSTTTASATDTNTERVDSVCESNATVGSQSEPLVVAEWNGHKHEEIPTSARWLYLVQYTAGAEGWNCIETDAMCFYSQTYSYRVLFQAHGRIDRLNTPFIDLNYYHLISKSVIDKAIRAALRVKKSFNERNLVL